MAKRRFQLFPLRAAIRLIWQDPALRLRAGLVAALVIMAVIVVGCLTIEDHKIKIVPIHKPTPTKPQPPPPPPPPKLDRTVRVRLFGPDPVTAFNLEVTCPYKLTAFAGGKVLTESATPLRAVRVTPARSLPDEIMFNAAQCGGGDIVVEPQREASVVVNGKTFRGNLRISRAGNGLVATNVLDIEDYLAGVLRGELPRDFHEQAQRALAVAARTYVLYEKITGPTGRDYDVLADERSQMYLGVLGEDKGAVDAVRHTRGEVCMVRDGDRDKIFCTYYSSACGGISQSVTAFRPSDPAIAPLAGGRVCNDCYLAPHYRWGPVKMSKAEMTRKLVARYPKLAILGQIVGVQIESVGYNDRIGRITLIGSNGGTETLVGEDFRLALGGYTIKSTSFKVVDEGKYLRFKDGRGFGHGVGLCQYGADRRARLGRTYRDILESYYPTSIIKKLYD